jgi:hypothetical protein
MRPMLLDAAPSSDSISFISLHVQRFQSSRNKKHVEPGSDRHKPYEPPTASGSKQRNYTLRKVLCQILTRISVQCGGQVVTEPRAIGNRTCSGR